MDASSARACSSSDSTSCYCAADEANTPLPLSSSSLPHSHYLQTSPHLLTTASSSSSSYSCSYSTFNQPNINANIANNDNNYDSNDQQRRLFRHNAQITATTAAAAAAASSCQSLDDFGNCQRRQSLKCDVPAKGPENDNSSANASSRSTSSPQLMNAKSRSKVYRRASLKSLTSLGSISSQQPVQSRIVRLTSRGKVADRRATPLDLVSHGNEERKLVSPHRAFAEPCSKNTQEPEKEKSSGVSQQQDEKQQQQQQQQQRQAKGKSCSSFLPILSLIPNTVISFQYPSPKMKFSWWRNKIS